MKPFIFLTAAVVCAGLTSSIGAQSLQLPGTTKTSDEVQATLIADTTAIAPGSTFTLGVLFKMQPEWHIYYKSPGGIGFATTVNPKLPDGFKAEEIQYPAPITFESPGPIVSYGYENEVLLSTVVTAPANIDADSVTLEVTSRWLMCKDRCIPKINVKSTLTLPVGKGQNANTAVFDKYQKQIPVKIAVPPSNVEIKHKMNGKASTFAVTVTPTAGSTIVGSGKGSAFFYPFDSKDHIIEPSTVNGKKDDSGNYVGPITITYTAESKGDGIAALNKLHGVLVYSELTKGSSPQIKLLELTKKF